jgi:hypothetical protein
MSTIIQSEGSPSSAHPCRDGRPGVARSHECREGATGSWRADAETCTSRNRVSANCGSQTRYARGQQGRGLDFRRLASGGLERRGEILGGRLDGLRHGHDEPPVAVYDLACVYDGQADDPLGAWREAKDVTFRGFLAFGGLGLTNVQVQDIALGVIVGVVELERADRYSRLPSLGIPPIGPR